jgi:hypothetical protein
MTNPGIEVPGGLPNVQVVVGNVARGLARAHGQRQFYSLAQVLSQAGAWRVDTVLSAWIYAAFVTRGDFDAFFAVRETPGGYGELRAAMSRVEPRVVPEPTLRDHDIEIEIDVDDLWWWLQLAAEAC